ncbi:hypothetical protein KEM52_000891 [Ascosphaera acerosa]|nr:hypothetical protein KEM52_000891 [Ascosphaera acerosa]
MTAPLYDYWTGSTRFDKLALTLLTASTVVCVGTRILTGLATLSQRPGEPKALPYWIPFVGHALPIALRRGWLESTFRQNRDRPGFKLLLFGRVYNVVTSAACIEWLSSQKECLSLNDPADRLAENLFTSTSRSDGDDDSNDSDTGEVKGRGKTGHAPPRSAKLFAGQGWLSPMGPELARDFCEAVTNRIQQTMPDLVTFLASAVDQQAWEKRCDEEPELEALGRARRARVDLFPLIREYVGYTLTAELMGSSFMEAYEVVLADIWLFDGKFDPILLGIPRWVPVPGLVPAYKARKRLLEGLTIFHQAYRKMESGGDPGVSWRDLDDVSPVMRVRAAQWLKCGTDERTAAAGDLSLLWAMNTEMASLVFWLIVYVLSDDDANDRIREEIAPYAKAWRPESSWSFKLIEPVQMTLDGEGLLRQCRVFRIALYETLRLTATELIVGRAKQQLSLSTATSTNTPASKSAAPKPSDQQTIRIAEGEYVAALVNSGHPVYGACPQSCEDTTAAADEAVDEGDVALSTDSDRFNLSRYTDETMPPRFRSGPLYDFETSATSEYEEQVILTFVAAFLVNWEVKPAEGERQSLVPPSRHAPLAREPEGRTRAEITPAL